MPFKKEACIQNIKSFYSSSLAVRVGANKIPYLLQNGQEEIRGFF